MSKEIDKKLDNLISVLKDLKLQNTPANRILLAESEILILKKRAERLSNDMDKVSIIGGNFGFGVEYFFSENFSLGGETGLMFGYLNFEYDDFGNYEEKNKTNFKMIYSNISLNFYF